MQPYHHRFCELFAQLGLPNAPTEICAFIQRHRPLDSSILLRDAPFWTPSQSDLIRQMFSQDSDWALAVDGLNTRLRAHTTPADLPQA